MFALALRPKKNPAGVAFEIEKGNGDARDYNIRTAAAAVLYDTSTRCTYSSLEPLVPGAAYLVYQAGSTCSRARYQPVSYTHLTLPTILLV